MLHTFLFVLFKQFDEQLFKSIFLYYISRIQDLGWCNAKTLLFIP